MDTLEAIAARIETTSDIRAIVRTMKALSAASIRRYERAAEATAEYGHTVELGLQALLRARRFAGARLAAGRTPAGRRALIVIGSDRGLCGRFNDRVAGFARDEFLGDPGAGAPLLCVLGLRAAARLEAMGHRANRILTLPGTVGGIAGTVQAAILQIDRWTKEERVTEVHLAHNRRGERARAVPTGRQLLPVQESYFQQLAVKPWPSRSLPAFSMEPAAILSWLIRQHLFVVLYRALAESLASEHSARLSAMQSAERNIDERGEELASAYRQKRQEAITRELLDVVAGFRMAEREE
jgi:F-type H+-transporting ATPase subunit gamma